jgi:cytochrome c biogenesis protein CcdA
VIQKKNIVLLCSALLFFTSFLNVGVFAVKESAVCVVYFTNSGCIACAEADLRVSSLLEEYFGRFVVVKYDILVSGHNDILTHYCTIYNSSVGVPLMIFGLNDFLSEGSLTVVGLKGEIDEYLAAGGNRFPLLNGSSVAFEDLEVSSLPGSPELLSGSTEPPLELPTVLAVIAAAAVDSINPCEFAVLVILLSGVLASGEKKKALKIGMAFVFTIFVMYLIMGFGIFSIRIASGLAYYFYKAIGIFALIIGALNVKDYFWEDAKGVWSSVPNSLRPKIQRLLDNVTSIPGAVFSGVVVSLFLLPCTSGPYIIVLGLLSYATTRFWATVLILLYNLIFILPMIGIVLAICFGLTSTAKAAHWRHRRMGLLHLIAGIIMIGMGVWMLFLWK